MRVLVVGATGTIGAAVVEALEGVGHDVIGVSRSSEPGVDIEQTDSIAAIYEEVGDVDAVICTAGSGSFGPLEELDERDFWDTIGSKLMGQINLVRLGLGQVSGSFTLTSGILAQQPWPGSSALAMVNGALESFGRAAALDMEGVRINVVSPPLVRETAEQMGMEGKGVPADELAQLYLEVLAGEGSGEVARMHDLEE